MTDYLAWQREFINKPAPQAVARRITDVAVDSWAAIDEVRPVLFRAFDFHFRRDQMNAVLHLASVRYSPLTVALARAAEALSRSRPLGDDDGFQEPLPGGIRDHGGVQGVLWWAKCQEKKDAP